MRLIFRIILISALTYFLSFILPWWICVIISGLVCLIIHGNGISSFISGFLGSGIAWLAYAWVLDVETKSILSEKIVVLFGWTDSTYLVLAAGIIGALCGGFGALTGSTFRSIFIRKKKKSFYSQ